MADMLYISFNKRRHLENEGLANITGHKGSKLSSPAPHARYYPLLYVPSVSKAVSVTIHCH